MSQFRQDLIEDRADIAMIVVEEHDITGSDKCEGLLGTTLSIFEGSATPVARVE